MGSEGNTAPGYPWQILVLAALFTLQSLYLAFFLTPPGDVPDEVGHYSYVRDIADGKIFPLLGESYMAPDLWGMPEALQRPESRENWIVQHPPLYYVLAAVPLAVGDVFTDSGWFLYRAPRIVSALALGALILVLFRTLVVAGVPMRRAILVAPTIGFVPMVTQLSSGTNNDLMLLLLSALAMLYLVRFVLGQRLSDAYLCALWLGLAGATKMTAWVMMAPVVGLLLFEMRQPLWAWLRHAAGILVVALALPVWWMVRNVIHFGHPMHIAGAGTGGKKVFDYGFLDLIRDEPVFDSFFEHFYGLFGFSGYCINYDLIHLCQGIQMTRLFLFPMTAFTYVMLVLTVVFLVYLGLVAWRSIFAKPASGPALSIREHVGAVTSNRIVGRMLLGAGVLVGAVLATVLLTQSYVRDTATGPVQLWIMAAAPLAGLTAFAAVLLPQEARDRIALYGPVVFLFFGAILLYQIYQGFLYNEWLRGVHGRYLYPVIPPLIVSVAIAFERLRVPTLAYLAIVLVLGLAFYDAFLEQVIPFYISVRV